MPGALQVPIKVCALCESNITLGGQLSQGGLVFKQFGCTVRSSDLFLVQEIYLTISVTSKMKAPENCNVKGNVIYEGVRVSYSLPS